MRIGSATPSNPRKYSVGRANSNTETDIRSYKELEHETHFLSLPKGAHLSVEYLAVNPSGLVPFLIDGDVRIGQSLAIIEYLDEVYPQVRLLPEDPAARAAVRALAQTIACDVHPLNNLRVQNYLRQKMGAEQPSVEEWARTWVHAGFGALEDAARRGGGFMFGGRLSLADVCLLPQLYNARRVFFDLQPYSALLAIERRLMEIPAFAASVPELQPDAVQR